MRKLTKKTIDVHWEFEQEIACNEIMQLLTQTPALKYYNIDKLVSLQCDASNYELGEALMETDQPVAFASRTLTRAEQNYCQLVKTRTYNYLIRKSG